MRESAGSSVWSRTCHALACCVQLCWRLCYGQVLVGARWDHESRPYTCDIDCGSVALQVASGHIYVLGQFFFGLNGFLWSAHQIFSNACTAEYRFNFQRLPTHPIDMHTAHKIAVYSSSQTNPPRSERRKPCTSQRTHYVTPFT